MMTNEQEILNTIERVKSFKAGILKLIEEHVESLGPDPMIMELELAKLRLATFHLSHMYKLPELKKHYEETIQKQG